MYSFTANFLQKKFNIDAHYFLKGGFWLSLTQVITIVGGLLTSVLFAHYLTPQDFGVYRYLIGLSALFAAFSLTGLGQAILQTAARGFYGFYIETIKINFIYSLGILIAGSLGFVYYFIQKNTLLAIGCIAIAFLQPIISSFSNTTSYLQGRRLYRESTLLQLIKVSIITLLSIGAIFITKNILILFIIFLLSNIFVNILGHSIFKPRKLVYTPTETFNVYKSYAINTSVRNTITNIANRIDSILVFTLMGGPELAIYTIATIVPEQIKGSVRNLANLLLPKYALQTNQNVLAKSVLTRSLQLFLLLTLITFLYIFIAPFLYSLLFPKYTEAIFYSQLLALALPSFVFLIPYTFLQSRLNERDLYKIIKIGSISQILFTLLFIVVFGILGAIIAKIIVRYLYLILTFYHFYKPQHYEKI